MGAVDRDIVERLKMLPAIMGVKNQTEVAAELGIGYTTWMSVINGLNGITTRWVKQIVLLNPGLTSDWILFGREELLTVQMRDRIRAASKDLPSPKGHK